MGSCYRKELRVWREVLKQDPCVYCVRTASEIRQAFQTSTKPLMTIDHIQPRDPEVGHRRHHWDNEAPACWNCNHTRGNLPLLHYLVQRKALADRFAPGPNNARNRVWKQKRRENRARALQRDLENL